MNADHTNDRQLATPQTPAGPAAIPSFIQDADFTVEARYWHPLPHAKLRCTLCHSLCTLSEGHRGACGVRENRNGTLYSLVYGRITAAHIDPVEKKPLFHFLPGTRTLSVATSGCNVHCTFCQNWELAQSRPEALPAEFVSADQLAALALQAHCPTIAFTYNEPTIACEYLCDATDAAHQAGLRTLIVSNGSLQAEPGRAVYGRMDAVKIDLKSFSDSFYRNVVKGRLQPVLETLTLLRKLDKWTEIVTLLVPTLNDSDEELRGLTRWIKTNLGAEVPLHFSQFHPAGKLMHLPTTPLATLERAKAIADAEGLHFVYIGNVPGHPAQHTYCPNCKNIVVERTGFSTERMLIVDGNCPACQQPIPGLWQA